MPTMPTTTLAAVAIEYTVIGFYLLLMIGVGLVLRTFNNNVSDYFRNGCKGTWWLVGASAFMTAFSAWTFTGAAGVAFEGGWSVMIIFLANVLGFTLHAIWLAPWFRQLRAITAPEVIRMRFGQVTQQFYAWVGVVTGLLYAAIWLYGLAIFSSAVFGFDIQFVIITLGLAVLLYSFFGGSWAVMATDFLQSLLLIPITLLVAFLCVQAIGGFGEMFAAIEARGLSREFQLIKEPGQVEGANDYTWMWVFAFIFYKVVGFSTLTSAVKYFSVKDGWEARKAAMIAGVAMLLGAFVWFIPPVVARLLFEDQVMAAAIGKPAEASYAIVAMELLPVGLTGLMVVAMFAATMSSMDSGLNRNAAVFTRDIYPSLCKLAGVTPLEGTPLLRLGQMFSMMFGFSIIGITLYFSQADGRGVFEWMMNIGAMLALPMATPMLLALFIKRAPGWSAVFAVICGLIPSAWIFFSTRWFDQAWSYQTTVFLNMGIGATAFIVTMPFWRYSSPAYRAQVDAFFERMHKPIDFAREVGEGNDLSQLKVVGSFAIAIGVFVCSLMLLPGHGVGGRLSILFVGLTVGLAGAALLFAGRRGEAKARRIRDAEAAGPQPVVSPEA